MSAADALDEECDCNACPRGTTLEGIDRNVTTAALTTALPMRSTRRRYQDARHEVAADALDQERGHRRTDDGTDDAFNDVLNEQLVPCVVDIAHPTRNMTTRPSDNADDPPIQPAQPICCGVRDARVTRS